MGKVVPFRVGLLDQPNFPGTTPDFQIFLPPDRTTDFLVKFEMNQADNVIPCRVPGMPGAVLGKPPPDIRRDADVKEPVPPVRKNINARSHAWVMDGPEAYFYDRRARGGEGDGFWKVTVLEGPGVFLVVVALAEASALAAVVYS